MLCYGGYALWDTYQIEQTASAEKFQTYRPDTGQDSFDSLKKENPEVIGWITVPDTEIDYPIVQAADNSKYLNTDVKGEFALCGSIFLDYRNASDFSDVNSVIYGHYMQKESMFGDLKLFADEEFFQTHCYGELYFNGQWHTLELFSFCEVDAYQKTIYDVKNRRKSRQNNLKIWNRSVCISENWIWEQRSILSAYPHAFPEKGQMADMYSPVESLIGR